MLPDRVSNPGPLTYESGALPIALRGPANYLKEADPSQLNSVLQIRSNRDMLGLIPRLVNFGQYAKFGECSIINPVFIDFKGSKFTKICCF